MTGLLASVMTPEEAEIAVAGGADIVDLKDPNQGALGALAAPVIRACVAQVAGRRPVSATVGDLPMAPDIVATAVARMAALELDFVKIGIFPGGDLAGCLACLAREAERGTRLVAVLFADRQPDFALVPRLCEAGFAGALRHPAATPGGGLRAHLDTTQLRGFVTRARAHDLLTGLAGSLRKADIGPLLALAPDYLGFRGALTAGGRGAGLDPARLAAIRGAIPQSSSSPAALQIAGLR